MLGLQGCLLLCAFQICCLPIMLMGVHAKACSTAPFCIFLAMVHALRPVHNKRVCPSPASDQKLPFVHCGLTMINAYSTRGILVMLCMNSRRLQTCSVTSYLILCPCLKLCLISHELSLLSDNVCCVKLAHIQPLQGALMLV